MSEQDELRQAQEALAALESRRQQLQHDRDRLQGELEAARRSASSALLAGDLSTVWRVLSKPGSQLERASSLQGQLSVVEEALTALGPQVDQARSAAEGARRATLGPLAAQLDSECEELHEQITEHLVALKAIAARLGEIHQERQTWPVKIGTRFPFAFGSSPLDVAALTAMADRTAKALNFVRAGHLRGARWARYEAERAEQNRRQLEKVRAGKRRETELVREANETEGEWLARQSRWQLDRRDLERDARADLLRELDRNAAENMRLVERQLELSGEHMAAERPAREAAQAERERQARENEVANRRAIERRLAGE